MRRQIIEKSALEVAQQVRAVEDRIEAALGELAELQARMVRARAVTRSAIATSHAAFEQLGVTTRALIDARGGIAQCHLALADAQRTIPGLRATGIGDDGDCPPASGAARLSVVG